MNPSRAESTRIDTGTTDLSSLTLDVNIAWRYYAAMIKGFRCPETEKVFRRRRSRKFGTDIQRVALRKLLVLDAVESLNELRIPPSNRLEKLVGRRFGEYSIRINDQWRICFRWKDGDAYDVEIVDYH
jgi:proteic killer suppression protein